MQSLKLIQKSANPPNTAIASQRLLDNVRASAMENILNGGSLNSSLSEISTCLEKILASCHCQVIPFNSNENSYKVIGIAKSAHEHFVEKVVDKILNGSHQDLTQALKNHQDIIYPDIFNTTIWRELHNQAKELDLVATWIIPIISATGKVCGTYLCLFNSSKVATEDDLKVLDKATKTASALIFHGRQKIKQLGAQISLKKQISKHQENITEINHALSKAINQRSEVQAQLLELEGLAALGTMMSSLTHEVNTPIGVSLTASSFLGDLQQDCFDKLAHSQLKQSELKTHMLQSIEASDIIIRNLLRADELIKTFKRLSIDQDSQNNRTINLCHNIYEVLLTLKPILKQTPHKFCINIPAELVVTTNPGALSQLFINLIMNSVKHAFTAEAAGRITITAKTVKNKNQPNELHLLYKDNGIGMTPDTIENMYKPFYTLARDNDGTGLGMYICNNIVMKTLKGSISCQSAINKGTEFTVSLPINE